MPQKNTPQRAREWRSIDLHLHTPASSDYQEPQATYLNVLQQAEERDLDIIAFTDHNTVAGYRRMRAEIEELELLERLKRLQPAEKERLAEYRRLLDKILVLPGFEFTATFGFHILGVFSPETPVRDIEHLLLTLKIPSEQLDLGSATVGATADVLTAYQVINEAGGLAIAAHVNSTNGVAMRGFGFGGQTKIAFTQDAYLHALEVTDLTLKGRRTTASFFNGSKPEYPRRMHCIQGSDAHRLARDPKNVKQLGVGDRATEVLIDEVAFDALKELFLSNDFARTRPHVPGQTTTEFDYVQQAREQGANIVQDFHDSMTQKGGKLYAVLCDICAFANTNGGTLYVGVSADPKQAPVGVSNHDQAIQELRIALERQVTPRLACTMDIQPSWGKTIVRVQVPRGDEQPYALDESKLYVRQEAETSLAVRDEIVQLVLRRYAPTAVPAPSAVAVAVAPSPKAPPSPPLTTNGTSPLSAPRTGVEIVATEERGKTRYHTVRNLRNNTLIKNVTRSSARKLWHYAITEREAGPPKPEAITWFGDLGLYKKRDKGGLMRYDLVQRLPDGLRVYFGVTEEGIHGEWRKVVGLEAGPVASVSEEPASLMPVSTASPPTTVETTAPAEGSASEVAKASIVVEEVPASKKKRATKSKDQAEASVLEAGSSAPDETPAKKRATKAKAGEPKAPKTEKAAPKKTPAAKPKKAVTTVKPKTTRKKKGAEGETPTTAG